MIQTLRVKIASNQENPVKLQQNYAGIFNEILQASNDSERVGMLTTKNSVNQDVIQSVLNQQPNPEAGETRLIRVIAIERILFPGGSPEWYPPY